MLNPGKTEYPPDKAVVIFDGDCNFCRFWVERWRRMTGDRFRYEPSQTEAEKFPDIPVVAYREAVQLVEPDGTVTSGADAVFRILSTVPTAAPLAAFVTKVPGILPLSRAAYGVIAEHRAIFSLLTRLVWGRDPSPSTYAVSRRLFAHALGLIFFCAFGSLALQLPGLFGSRGIEPSSDFLRAVHEQIGNDAYSRVPTIFWLGSSDGTLMTWCIVGLMLSAILAVGIAPGFSALLCWGLYLSFCSVGSPFLNFQWDALLLETGLLAVFFLPWRFRPRWTEISGISTLGRILLWWLVFRLMFESGIVKLTYNDQTWLGYTATIYHYETQPLPLWTAWYANQAPLWFHKLEVFVVYVIEMGAPFLIPFPRRIRHTGAIALIFLQVLILVTGNYAFFNWLSIALCLSLFDDLFWPKSWRRKLAPALLQEPIAPIWRSRLAERLRWLPWAIAIPVTVAIALITTDQLAASIWPQSERPLMAPIHSAARWLEDGADSGPRLGTLESINSYGLFRVMTTERREIVVQGSNDGSTWLDYEFRWKPGDIREAPHLVAPHQPRLDWQMWFAALGTYQQNPWFINFLVRLLQGSPDVLALLGPNPFPEKPPRYVRAVLYQYHFTHSGDGGAAWWRREFLDLYSPPISLRAKDEVEATPINNDSR